MKNWWGLAVTWKTRWNPWRINHLCSMARILRFNSSSPQTWSLLQPQLGSSEQIPRRHVCFAWLLAKPVAIHSSTILFLQGPYMKMMKMSSLNGSKKLVNLFFNSIPLLDTLALAPCQFRWKIWWSSIYTFAWTSSRQSRVDLYSTVAKFEAYVNSNVNGIRLQLKWTGKKTSISPLKENQIDAFFLHHPLLVEIFSPLLGQHLDSIFETVGTVIRFLRRTPAASSPTTTGEKLSSRGTPRMFWYHMSFRQIAHTSISFWRPTHALKKTRFFYVSIYALPRIATNVRLIFLTHFFFSFSPRALLYTCISWIPSEKTQPNKLCC